METRSLDGQSSATLNRRRWMTSCASALPNRQRTFYAHASKDAKKKFFPKWLGYQIAGLIILSLIGWVIVKLNL